MKTDQVTELRDRILVALRSFADLRKAPDDIVATALGGLPPSPEDLTRAVSDIYSNTFSRCTKEAVISPQSQRLIDRLAVLLQLDDDQVVDLQYKVGMEIYKKNFAAAASKGQLSADAQARLESVRRFFRLHKSEVKQAVAEDAVTLYARTLTEALQDGTLTDSQMQNLASLARSLGLTSKQLKTIPIPNKKEVLANTLTEIKSRGEITPADYEDIRAMAEFLNAPAELLKPCLMDLDLYAKLFAIRQGNIPVIDSDSLILERGEQLHYCVPATYEVVVGKSIKRQTGTLYIGNRKLRFVGLRRSHEMRYANLLQVDFTLQKKSKVTIVVSSGAGGGDYRLKSSRDPGRLVEIQEAIQFLTRKAKGMEVSTAAGSRYIPADVRSEVWYRDGGQCVQCGAREYLEFDHVIPHSKGGATTTDNLQILCRKCNSVKNDSI